MLDYKPLTGRQRITSPVSKITGRNVVSVLNNAISIHDLNSADIQYLQNYVRGTQPILSREPKYANENINNHIIINKAAEITEFKTSYFLGESSQYIANSDDTPTQENISLLNKYMASQSKSSIDQSIAYNMHTCGLGYRFIKAADDTVPFRLYSLDPKDTFVVYYSGIEGYPLMGVHRIWINQDIPVYAVWTPSRYYLIQAGVIKESKPHILGDVPIIEYCCNETRQGAFEPVLSLLDAENELESSRLDGVQINVQAFLKFVNCGISADQLEEFKQKGAIMINSEPGLPSDVDYMEVKLSQDQTQILLDDLNEKILTIVGMPSQSDGKNTDSSNNGAAIVSRGWQSADTRAKGTEKYFKLSERRALGIISRLMGFNDILIDPKEIDIRFDRRNYADILTKAQALTTMLSSNKVAPIDAYSSVGMFPDSTGAAARGEEYFDKMRENS